MTRGRRRAPWMAMLLVGVSATLLAHDAIAAPSGGSVQGVVKLAKPSDRGPAPRRGRGFTQRISNPLKPPRAFNPLPELVVVLEGGTPDPADTKPGAAVKYRMIGESFEIPVLAVLAGTSVDVVNDSQFERAFHSPDDKDVTAQLAPAMAPGKKRSLKKFGPAGKTVELRVKDSAHISGTLVAFEHPYFSRVDDDGKFEIKGVPAGSWKIKIWYKGGWVAMPDVKVGVVANKAVSAAVDLPAKLKTAGKPAPEEPPEKKLGDETEGEGE